MYATNLIKNSGKSNRDIMKNISINSKPENYTILSTGENIKNAKIFVSLDKSKYCLFTPKLYESR